MKGQKQVGTTLLGRTVRAARGDPRIHMRRVIKIDYLLWSSGTLHFLIKTFREENMVINFVLESNWNQVATPADICDYNYDMFYFYLQDVKR